MHASPISRGARGSSAPRSAARCRRRAGRARSRRRCRTAAAARGASSRAGSACPRGSTPTPEPGVAQRLLGDADLRACGTRARPRAARSSSSSARRSAARASGARRHSTRPVSRSKSRPARGGCLNFSWTGRAARSRTASGDGAVPPPASGAVPASCSGGRPARSPRRRGRRAVARQRRHPPRGSGQREGDGGEAGGSLSGEYAAERRRLRTRTRASTRTKAPSAGRGRPGSRGWSGAEHRATNTTATGSRRSGHRRVGRAAPVANSFTASRPNTKPPMCAKYATPPPPVCCGVEAEVAEDRLLARTRCPGRTWPGSR